ncbi:bacteriocin [Bradyrhizobium sp. AZCC 2289]|jgi:bacteriocin-like protein|uniref:bacteriocin n=1 Tax=Bradyrhizobium sp. AZCC 2289 TaxID=3117026 RepID=UPI000927761E|nr:bacteriocin-type signal sequence-containing protein [Bradyrhizobium erythrophlei]SIO49139.1 bacteriocin-type signal sequence-containing protein [Bradyrhizobium erythrophlei]SIO52290.1 bacteriocin-type signal sequence-containing protein [Bradyrhizobium erythrophlei]
MSKLNNGIRELNIDELDQVSGGNRSQVNDPWYRGPKLGAPQGSIAQGDTLDNTLTFDQLP